MARPIRRFLGRPFRYAERWFAVTDGFIWVGQSPNRAWKLWQGAGSKVAGLKVVLFFSVHESRGFLWTYEPWLSNVFAQKAIFDLQELILQRMHFHRCFIVLTYHKISNMLLVPDKNKLQKHFPFSSSGFVRAKSSIGPEKTNHVPLKHRGCRKDSDTNHRIPTLKGDFSQNYVFCIASLSVFLSKLIN